MKLDWTQVNGGLLRLTEARSSQESSRGFGRIGVGCASALRLGLRPQPRPVCGSRFMVCAQKIARLLSMNRRFVLVVVLLLDVASRLGVFEDE